MLQKLVVGLLALTLIGAAVIGIYDATNQNTSTAAATVLADPTQGEQIAADALVAETSPSESEADLASPPQGDLPAQIDPTPAPVEPAAPAVPGQPVQQQLKQELQQAVNMVGDPWAGQGTITGFDTAGMTLALAAGSEIYVELGPPHAWQDGTIILNVGDQVSVTGFYNGVQYHAGTVTTAAGEQLVLRDENGLPSWSGGAGTQSQGANGAGAGGNTAEPQVAPDQWVTVEGVVETVNGSTLTMRTQAGETLMLQLGQPSFLATQNITFVPGDPISVIGYWQGTQFRAGDITKTATGERLMLLDPNGRPLWGGPGRNTQQGQTGAQGQGAQGQGAQGQNTTGAVGRGQGGPGQQAAGQGTLGTPDPLLQGQNQGIQGQGGQGQGQNAGGGNGRGYRGGRQ